MSRKAKVRLALRGLRKAIRVAARLSDWREVSDLAAWCKAIDVEGNELALEAALKFLRIVPVDA